MSAGGEGKHISADLKGQTRDELAAIAGVSHDTMQLYVNTDDEPLSIGIARTADIMDFIDKGYARSGHTGYDQVRQATFFICDWSRMQDEGYAVRTWHKDEQQR